MNDAKHIGLDGHQATVSVAVLDSTGKLADRGCRLVICESALSLRLRKIFGLAAKAGAFTKKYSTELLQHA